MKASFKKPEIAEVFNTAEFANQNPQPQTDYIGCVVQLHTGGSAVFRSTIVLPCAAHTCPENLLVGLPWSGAPAHVETCLDAEPNHVLE